MDTSKLTEKSFELFALGKQHVASRKYDQAIEVFSEALEIGKLLGEDACIAASLNFIGTTYTKQGNYARAQEPLEQALELEKKLGLYGNVATKYNNLGVVCESQGKLAHAEKYYKQAIELDKKLGREANRATVLNNIGLVYQAQNKFAQAEESYKEALELNERLEREQNKATVLNNLGLLCCKQEKHDLAREYFEQVLAIEKKLGHEAEMAATLNNLGITSKSQTNYTRAENYFKQSLAIAARLKLQEDEGVAQNNLGIIFREQGRYALAEKAYKKALDSSEQLGNQKEKVIRLNNLGGIYEAQGKYAQAEESFTQALAISKQLEDKEGIATIYNNLGALYKAQQKHTHAQEKYEQALKLATELNMFVHKATALNNMGTLYKAQCKYQLAEQHYKAALEINEQVEKQDNIATTLNSLGLIYCRQEKYELAQSCYDKALAIEKKLARPERMATILNNIGGLHYAKENDYVTALTYFEQAAGVIKKSEKQLRKENYLAFREKYVDTNNSKLSCLAHLNDYQHLYKAIEESRGRHLCGSLMNREFIGKDIPQLEDIQKRIPDACQLVYLFSTKANAELGCLHITKRSLQLSNFQIANIHFQKSLQAYLTAITTPGDFSECKRNSQKLTSVLSPLLKQLETSDAALISPSGEYYTLPFEALQDENEVYLIEKYKQEIVYTPSMTAYVHLGKRVPQKCTKQFSLAAFGCAVYDYESFEIRCRKILRKFAREKKMIPEEISTFLKRWQQLTTTECVSKQDEHKTSFEETNNQKVSYYITQIEATKEQEEIDQICEEFYGAQRPSKNLLHSLEELIRIKINFPDTTLFTADEVTKQQLFELSKAGELKNYDMLHFAIHGIVPSNAPELSTLMFSAYDKNGAKIPCYLTTREIEKLDIQAQLVNLSACQTALGKMYYSEGVLGLAQAFLVAGARGVGATLWQVDDLSTSIFVNAAYTTMKEQNISYPKAIAQVKRRFITGEFGEDYKHPFYWAPYIYYGPFE